MEDEGVTSELEELVERNSEGLEKLASEEPAVERRERPVRAEIKRLYRKYVKKPEAEPAIL